jgi:ubiquitin carboxyl-terminal hydrolase 8
MSAVSLDQCLDAFLKIEILDKDDSWCVRARLPPCCNALIIAAIRNCPRCKKPRKASKQLSISRLPPILLIHLKRFSFKGPFSDRIDSVIHFPLTDLDLTTLLPPPLPSGTAYKENQPMPPPTSPRYSYDLYGVSNHFGTLSSGHCKWDGGTCAEHQGLNQCGCSQILRL